MTAAQKKIKIAITTGDTTGIGYEVATKALTKLGLKPNVEFYIYRGSQALPIHQRRLKRCRHNIQEIVRNDNPAVWFYECIQKCKSSEYDAIVTGPLAKKTIQKKFPKMGGHTDILKDHFGKNLVMTFLGAKMNVLLATDHVALTAVPAKITLERLKTCLLQAQNLCRALNSRKAIGLIGLNPHAGEVSKLGHEESAVFKKALLWAKKNNLSVSNPLVPDVAFQPHYIKNHDIYIAMYHDQGLIPFKMLHHKNHGAQITLGLPFVRTSVDHGTAEDIFLDNAANPSSMLEAIRKAVYFVSQNR